MADLTDGFEPETPFTIHNIGAQAGKTLADLVDMENMISTQQSEDGATAIEAAHALLSHLQEHHRQGLTHLVTKNLVCNITKKTQEKLTWQELERGLMDCKLEFMVKYAANPKHYEALLIEEEQAREANRSN